jgi:non-ribosomal peptide synthetase component F/acyl carrier protein
MAALHSAGGLPDSIRVVNLAGEPLQSELVEQLYRTGSVEKVYDLYGPSETTTYSTFTRRNAKGAVTIGRPIANTQIYLLGPNRLSVPIGVPGEIYIGGAGVARGYFNRPDLTGENFIANPFSYDSSDRLYRTGDLGRYLPDGNIQFIGRIDTQVKIRGYRIELGEIEAVLNQHPAVKDSVIVLRARDASTEEHLIGYVVPSQRSLSLAELREYLGEKLPHYMIPSTFLILDSLPLTANGKIDRRALPAPSANTRKLKSVFTKPRTDLEELIAQTWQEILKIENVGILDNFFALGGHSLLALQIIARLQGVINKEIPLRVLFDTPTIAELTKEIEKILREGHLPELPPIVPVPRDGPLPLSMNQEHLWQLRSLMPANTNRGVIPHGLRLSGAIHVDVLEKALQGLVERHEAIRTVFAESNGSPVQIIKDGSDIRLENIDLRDQTGNDLAQRAAMIILELANQSFDLAAGPLFRLRLLRLTDTESISLLVIHHIIGDEWSIQILRRELFELYDSILHRQSSSLPLTRVQFADYACWEKRLLAEGGFREHSAYWAAQLSGQVNPFHLQNLSKDNKQLSFMVARAPIDTDEALLQILKEIAAKENVTVFIVLLTALYILLHSYTRQSDISIAVLVANRGRKEIEMTVGYFLNTIVLRTHIRPANTVRTFLREVRSLAVSAYAHQDFPFEQIVRVLETKDDDFDRSRLCPVLLNYRPKSLDTPKISGLKIAELDLHRNMMQTEFIASAFDLIFDLRESSTKLTGSVNYKTELFPEEDVLQMTKALSQLVRRVAFAPDQRISALYSGLKF